MANLMVAMVNGKPEIGYAVDLDWVRSELDTRLEALAALDPAAPRYDSTKRGLQAEIDYLGMVLREARAGFI